MSYSELNRSKNDNIQEILSQNWNSVPQIDKKKYTSSSSKSTSRFLLKWRKTPWQYNPEKKVKSKTGKNII